MAWKLPTLGVFGAIFGATALRRGFQLGFQRGGVRERFSARQCVAPGKNAFLAYGADDAVLVSVCGFYLFFITFFLTKTAFSYYNYFVK